MTVRFAAAIAALVLPLAVVAASQASHLFSDTAGHTTTEQVLTGAFNPSLGYSNLNVEQPGESYTVRDPAGIAQAGRDQRRRSLAYMGQLTDFQLADEESPARVEFLDPGASSAWRPQEAFQPFIIDWSIRQMNLFAAASPVQQGDGSRNSMDFALVTGDQADSVQRNEMIWVRELIEGGTPLDFNSGSTNADDYNATEHPTCAGFPPTVANRAEALRYTGVQDYDDYDETQTPLYYDPDDPRGSWATGGWPTYAGLMDRAQQLTITPAGLAVPSYVTNGNHDALVQGNEDANAGFEAIATSCLKMLASTVQPGPGVLDPSVLLAPPSAATLVPPDPLRRYVSKPQVKAVFSGEDNGHGFDFVDPAQETASNDSASYYAWDPPEAPGFRFVSIDTNSEGGQTAEGAGCGSANGNIDDPQFQWLKNELNVASQQDKLIVIFGHHPVRSLCAEIADEQASPCTVNDAHGDVPEHDVNPGCDLDPRVSEPIHLGQDPVSGDPRESFVELLDQYPLVVSYISGHTHENNIEPFTRTDGSVWWGIESSATADWPVQHRLIEVMDNKDGTLSIFGTILDHAAAAAAPAPGNASGFTNEQLASIGRVFAFNDPQAGSGSGEGSNEDRNVELLLRDPRARYPRPGSATPLRAPLVPEYTECTAPNSQHVAPLNVGACSPPSQDSALLTTSTVGKGSGFVSFKVQPGNPSTPADESDVAFSTTVTDVRQTAGGGDYTGQLVVKARLRMTDTANGPTQSTAATVQDFDFAIPVSCVASPNPTLGSACSEDTTLDALVPGFAKEGERTIIDALSLLVQDMGADGDIDPGSSCPPTCGTGDEGTFLREGVVTP